MLLDGAEVVGGQRCDGGALADVAAHEPVVVIVGGRLRGRVRLCEVDLDAGQVCEVSVAGHPSALVPR